MKKIIPALFLISLMFFGCKGRQNDDFYGIILNTPDTNLNYSFRINGTVECSSCKETDQMMIMAVKPVNDNVTYEEQLTKWGPHNFGNGDFAMDVVVEENTEIELTVTVKDFLNPVTVSMTMPDKDSQPAAITIKIPD